MDLFKNINFRTFRAFFRNSEEASPFLIRVYPRSSVAGLTLSSSAATVNQVLIRGRILHYQC